MSPERRYAPDYAAAVEDYLTCLDEHGLSHGVLVQPSFLGTDNEYLLRSLSTHRDRLRGIAVIAPDSQPPVFDDLARCGIVGVRLNLVGKPLEDYNTRGWQTFFERVALHGWSVEIQRPIEDLAAIVPSIRAAGADVVIDHFGLPDGVLDPTNPAHRAFLDLLDDRGIWLKLSAAYRCNASPAQARRSVAVLRAAAGGIDRLVWGSDWPHTRYEHVTHYGAQRALLATLLADAAERHTVLVSNPSRLFSLDRAELPNGSTQPEHQ
ncbi:amidohydrolase 2 [Salinisphaera hydrothermalis C27AD]